MKNREIQKISNGFTRNILIIHGIVFILEKETIKGQTEALSELARQVRHDYKSPLMAIKSVIDRAKLKDFEKKTLSIAHNKMISMLGDLSQENIKTVLKNRQKVGKGKALTHVY